MTHQEFRNGYKSGALDARYNHVEASNIIRNRPESKHLLKDISLWGNIGVFSAIIGIILSLFVKWWIFIIGGIICIIMFKTIGDLQKKAFNKLLLSDESFFEEMRERNVIIIVKK